MEPEIFGIPQRVLDLLVIAALFILSGISLGEMLYRETPKTSFRGDCWSFGVGIMFLGSMVFLGALSLCFI